jgi:hypothetical protein
MTMPMLKEMWNVWMTGEQDSTLRPLLSLLDNYGISYDQGWIEHVADPDERWPMGEDLQSPLHHQLHLAENAS